MCVYQCMNPWALGHVLGMESSAPYMLGHHFSVELHSLALEVHVLRLLRKSLRTKLQCMKACWASFPSISTLLFLGHLTSVLPWEALTDSSAFCFWQKDAFQYNSFNTYALLCENFFYSVKATKLCGHTAVITSNSSLILRC